MDLKKPLFIVFEGIDGSGKTTLSKMLYSYLMERGFEVLWFREPSDSEWGRRIRKLASSEKKIPIEEELEYFIKDRKWNVKKNLLPALAKNKIMILDRYYFSTACYQGARGLNMDEIIKKNIKFAPEPDITFIIDVDVKIALERIKQNRDSKAILFERRDFLEKVRKNYLKLKKDNIYIINGNLELNDVFINIKNLIALNS